jgi:hypothetical protein
VVAAQPLHSHDPALGQGLGRPLERLLALAEDVAARADEAEMGTAHRAGVGLGVEAAVGRVLVLLAAVVAHGEHGHGGGSPVVGDREDDRVAGTAVRAVDERVAVAPVGGVEELEQAVVAGGDVDAHGHGRSAHGPTVDDREPAPFVGRLRARTQ